MLVDRFNRTHNYLRISVTDDCNFRCSYCMPDEHIRILPDPKLMQPHEIEEIARTFVDLGVTKIRLTGGEPLVRYNIDDIILRLGALPVELTITTNGSRLRQMISVFREAGIRSVNVSLDSLNPEVFAAITRRDQFDQVWENILLLLDNQIRVKINTVAVAGVIEKEIHDFIELTRDLPLHVRFIEFMPFAGNRWQSDQVVTAQQMLGMAGRNYDLVKLTDEPHATAKKYQVPGYQGTIAFITTMSNQFCGSCNRMRLTADGKMKNCLFGREETDILKAYRAGEPIETLIRESVMRKYRSLGGQLINDYRQVDPATIKNRSMIRIGG
ncbi:MAG: GTP 3',8-cyclase MoaA [Mangrovibacterium sp.]